MGHELHRIYPLTKPTKMISEFDISWNSDKKVKSREEYFNYNDREGQILFKSLTTETAKFTNILITRI